jgi:diguanylate cyclase
MDQSLSPERLVAIIQTQNEIAASALDLEAVMSLVVDRAQSLTDAAAAVVELADGKEMVYHAVSGTASRHRGFRLHQDRSLSGLCVQSDQILLCRNAETDPRVDREGCRSVGAMSMVCVPLRHSERVVGVLKVYDPAPEKFSGVDVQTLSLLSGVITSHMAHANEFELHRHESRHDALTGLPNWRAFDDSLSAELARIQRHGGRLSLCLLDLDGFKQVNDTLGHGAGNQLLQSVARKLMQIREEDSVFRLGGDEFALILVGADENGGRIAAERVTAALRAEGVSLSYGVASLARDDDQTSLLIRADRAMHAAKRGSAGAVRGSAGAGRARSSHDQ